MTKPWKIVFMGTPEFAKPSLAALIQKENVIAVYTQPDRPKGRGQKSIPSVIKEIALKNEIPCFQPETLKDESVLKQISSLAPDLIVVVAYGLFLPTKILSIPKYKVLNVHPSLLPKYRGAAPMQWALINGDSKTGVTILYMSSKMDAGDILLQKDIPILEEDNFESLQKKLSQLGAELLLRVIEGLKKDTITAKSQIETAVTLAPKLTKEIGCIDWNNPSRSIFNLIRGVTPWPGAHTKIDHTLLKIHSAKVVLEDFQGKPGRIHSLEKEGIVVETPKGCLLLTEVQKPNKRKMHASEFLRGQPLTIGSFFQHV